MPLPDPYRRDFQRLGYTPDPAQLEAIARLEQLRARLKRAERRERRLLWRLRVAIGRAPARRPIPGVYLWGGVGRGKTLLLDLFYSSLEVPARRAHFHRFMQEVHARLEVLRAEEVADPLERIGADLARAIRVLCFDELYVSDIADAMLLAGLFRALTSRGVTLCFTSNVPPAGLYKDGLQRSRFLPAIALLESSTVVVEVNGAADYRLRQLKRAPLYLTAHAEDSDAFLLQRFEAITGEAGTEGGAITIGGRPIAVCRRAAGAIWFEFQELCEGPRATSDYIEIANQFQVVFLANVPVLDAEHEDAARRLIALVDEFYERGVKLVVSAAAAPEALYHGERLKFEFRRTISRLAEMQSHDYLARPHHG